MSASSRQNPLNCSVIIATLDRIESLCLVLDCLDRQTHPPHEIIIVAAGDTAALIAKLSGRNTVKLVPHPVKSSALQRNHAAGLATGDVLAFLDDDIEFGPELLERMLSVMALEPGIGGLHPRIRNMERASPRRLTRAYYALQAGYSDQDYGGRLFGPAINCAPVFSDENTERVQADWLPATCLFVRSSLFKRYQFPAFTGYSFAEDVHLTARIAKDAALFFLREPSILHHSLPSEFKADQSALTSGKLHNMAVVAREAMGLRGGSLWWRWQLHRLFLTAVFLIRRPSQWTAELRGIWKARL